MNQSAQRQVADDAEDDDRSGQKPGPGRMREQGWQGIASDASSSLTNQSPKPKRCERNEQRIVAKGIDEIPMQQLVQRPLSTAPWAIQAGQRVKSALRENAWCSGLN